MKRPITLAVLCLALSLLPIACGTNAPAPPTPTATESTPGNNPALNAKDQEQLQGIWSLVSLHQFGKQVPENDVERIKTIFVYQDNKYLWYRYNELFEQGTFALNTMHSPKKLDNTKWILGKSSVEKGIYEINGDTLRVCLAGGGDYPKDFVSRVDGLLGTVTFEFKRLAQLGDTNGPILGTSMPVTPQELARALGDEKLAKIYSKKLIIVEGVLVEHSPRKEAGDRFTLFKQERPDEEPLTVTCTFTFQQFDEVKALKVGQRVRVSGYCPFIGGDNLNLSTSTILK